MSWPHRHLQRKSPRKTRGFAWARVPENDHGIVTYRLTRGDARNVLHYEQRSFDATACRSDIARSLWLARIRLRDRVDELSLQQLGVIGANVGAEA